MSTPHDSVVRITVDESDAVAINPGMWGVFFEDINTSADGGLYAELIRNRNFDFTERDAQGWGPLTGWTTKGAVRPSGTPVRVELDGRDAPASITNHGFDGIAVREGEPLILELGFEVLDGDPTLVVTLYDANGSVLAEGSGADRRLIPSGDCVHAQLTATVTDGTVAVSWVSLFPERTWRGDPNGLRSDLADAIAALRPRFVRFPGGCVAHGLGLDNVYRWKDTIGPVRERVGDSNLWGYHQSMGLGYFEYFRFCEQLGAEPLPVLAAGVCCQNTPGGQAAFDDEQLAAYIDDIRDLIAWANAPADSRWGAVRAAAGHPEPFGLRYLGIGNEDEQTPAFRSRFGEILAVLRTEHPEITVIGTAGPFPSGADYETGWAIARELEVPIVDEHSYKAPKWYFQNLDRFDRYDRSGPKVYVGEYGSRGNTMLCALAEAAYMMAMERNGDIVHLASYAPLLAKVGSTQWEPDLVYFDNERVLPSLNYWVQQMHAHAAGDRALPVDVAGAPQWQRRRSERTRFSVRTASGTLTVENVSVEDASGRRTAPGAAGVQRYEAPVDAHGTDVTYRARVQLDGGQDGFVVAFGDAESDLSYEWHFGTWQEKFLVLGYVADGLYDEWTEPLPFTWSRGHEFDLEIVVRDAGRHISCSIDGEIVHDVEEDPSTEERFSATAIRDAASGRTVVKVVNATDEPVDLVVGWAGGGEPHRMRVTELSAPAGAGRPFEAAPSLPTERVEAGSRTRVAAYSFAVLDLDPEPSR